MKQKYIEISIITSKVRKRTEETERRKLAIVGKGELSFYKNM